MGNIVTVVDAVNGTGNLDRFPESVRQAAVADRLIMSKTDLADAETVGYYRAKATRLNPTADILPIDDVQTPDASLFVSDIHDANQGPARSRAGWPPIGTIMTITVTT